jgi:TPR repeat protein
VGVATDRAVLIRYCIGEERFVGSGLRVRERFVLTAAHCAQGSDHQVEFLNGSGSPATVHVRSTVSEVDLAVLILGEDAPAVEGLGVARVDRSVAGNIKGCQALGFPKWRRDAAGARILAQVDGLVPTVEGLRPGYNGANVSLLELKATGPSVREHPLSPGVLVQASPWGGMSGAGVVVDGVVLGVVCSHNLAAGGMSLTVTPLTALAALPGPVAELFTDALGVSGTPHWRVLPDRLAELSRSLLRVVDGSGRPPPVEHVGIGAFGARKARSDLDLHGDDYYPYVPREVDARILEALNRRVDGSDRRMLLLVGEAMTGKSRMGAQALLSHPVLRSQPLLVPARGPGMAKITGLVTEVLSRSGSEVAGAVIWLDDLNEYYAWLSEELAAAWRATSALTVMATVRRDQLAALQHSAELRATWEFVNDEDQVEKISIPSEWSQADQSGLADAPDWVREAVAEGTPLGELLGSAQELLRKLENADAPMRALVEAVVDWQRTGVPGPMPQHQVLSLWLSYLPLRKATTIGGTATKQVESRLAKARKEACTPIRGTATALLTLTGDAGLLAEDLVTNQRTSEGLDIRPAVWAAALEHALDTDRDLVRLIGYNALHTSGRLDVARQAWQAAAERGDHLAQHNLGLLLATELEPPEFDGGRRWLTAAAAAGVARAQYNLGVLLSARVDPPELEEARRWFTAAAEAGHSDAQNNLGILLSDRLDPPEDGEARRWFSAAAEAGHSGAQSNLGVLLSSRLDPPEFDEARHWFTQAAESGHTDAQYNLGLMLEDQLDPPDYDEARRWYTAAAEAGHTDAQYNLGTLLECFFDPPELDEARRWYTAAAEAGHTDAQYNLKDVRERWN